MGSSFIRLLELTFEILKEIVVRRENLEKLELREKVERQKNYSY